LILYSCSLAPGKHKLILLRTINAPKRDLIEI
jgi:hypothetical protein